MRASSSSRLRTSSTGKSERGFLERWSNLLTRGQSRPMTRYAARSCLPTRRTSIAIVVQKRARLSYPSMTRFRTGRSSARCGSSCAAAPPGWGTSLLAARGAGPGDRDTIATIVPRLRPQAGRRLAMLGYHDQTERLSSRKRRFSEGDKINLFFSSRRTSRLLQIS